MARATGPWQVWAATPNGLWLNVCFAAALCACRRCPRATLWPCRLLKVGRHEPQLSPVHGRASASRTACIHGVSVVGSLAAAATLMTVAILYLPPLSTVSIVVYCIGMIAVFGFSAGYNLVGRPGFEGHPAALRSRGDLREDRRHLHAVRAGEAGGRGRLRSAGSGLGGRAVRRRRQAVLAGAARAHIVCSCISRKGWACACRIEPAYRRPCPGASLTCSSLGGALYTLGVVFHLWHSLALPQRHLARLRAGGVGLPLRGRRRRRRPQRGLSQNLPVRTEAV